MADKVAVFALTFNAEDEEFRVVSQGKAGQFLFDSRDIIHIRKLKTIVQIDLKMCLI